MAGEGAPVAVAAATLIGLGFKPLTAAVVCLVANTPPVPFGPVGVPTSMMISVTIGGSVRFDPAAFAAWLRQKIEPSSVRLAGNARGTRRVS